MADVYDLFAYKYLDKYLKKTTYSNLTVPTISLEGATVYYIQKEFEYRPDLIAFYTYGSVDYEDYITFANKFVDPMKDYYAGRKIYLPAINQIDKVRMQ